MKVIYQTPTIIVHGPDLVDQKVVVKGRVWRFDYDQHFGPLWLREDGNQNVPAAVWRAYERWEKRRGL